MAKPKRINYKPIFIAVLVCVAAAVIFLAGLWTKNYGRMAGLEESQLPGSSAYGSVQTAEAAQFDLSVWVAYWDFERGLNDVNSIAGMPDSLQALAASFNAADWLFFTADSSEMILALDAVRDAHPDMPVYLTLVNDRMDGNGEWTEKDGSLVDRLMKTEGTRAKHIDDIVILARGNGFDGVEIDYENISGDAKSGFALFCGELYARLNELGMELRVVLEPDNDFADGGLPEGPEYVMMAYDMNGAGTAPGPRADEAFIRSLAAKMASLPGEKRIAFASGGFDWDAAGNAREITESEAYGLSLESGDIQRDVNSGELFFTYAAEDGSAHTVWYADAETLAGWLDLSKSLGYGNVAVWRMGGETPETLKMLGNLKGVSLN